MRCDWIEHSLRGQEVLELPVLAMGGGTEGDSGFCPKQMHRATSQDRGKGQRRCFHGKLKKRFGWGCTMSTVYCFGHVILEVLYHTA